MHWQPSILYTPLLARNSGDEGLSVTRLDHGSPFPVGFAPRDVALSLTMRRRVKARREELDRTLQLSRRWSDANTSADDVRRGYLLKPSFENIERLKVAHRWVRVNHHHRGVWLHCLSHTPASGVRHNVSPIVFLSGFGMSGVSWVPVWRELQGRQLIAIDLPGQGPTGDPGVPCEFSELATLVVEAVEKLQLHNPILVAHGEGAAVADRIIAKARDMPFSSLIRIGYPVYRYGHHMLPHYQVLQDRLIAARLASNSTLLFLSLLHSLSAQRAPSTLRHRERMAVDLSLPQTASAALRYIHDNDPSIELEERRSAFRRRTEIPKTLMHGELDPVHGPQHLWHYREAVPNAQLAIIPDAGHYPHVEEPHHVAHVILGAASDD